MKSKLSQIKAKLRIHLKKKEIIDIIVFGSAIKGKSTPRDIDIAIISQESQMLQKDGFHISNVTPVDFIKNPPTIITTLLREGFSLRHNKPFAETLRFTPRLLYTYSLSNLSNSKKVQAVNTLRGKKEDKGIVKEYQGEWLAPQVFTIPTSGEHIINKFMDNFQIKYKKSFILIH